MAPYGAEFSIQHSACSIQHSALSIQHSAFSIQHSACSIQHSDAAFSIQQFECNPVFGSNCYANLIFNIYILDTHMAPYGTEFSIQHYAFSMQNAALRMQNAALSMQMQHSVCRMQL